MTSQPSALSLNETGKEQVGRFMKYVGDLIGVSYGCDGSGATRTQVYNALRSAGYTTGGIMPFYVETVNNSLYQKQLVYMRGSTSSGAWHGWVIEGFNTITSIYALYEHCSHSEPAYLEEEMHEENYHYYNLGWGGVSNGWYYVPPKSYSVEGLPSGLKYSFYIIPYI